jgi:Phytanoyl-CoA dioxygenase (PhyH)
MGLQDEGYVILDALLSERDLRDIRASIAALHEKAKADPLFRTGGTLHLDGLLEIGEPYDRVWTNERLVGAVTSLLGSEYRIGPAHMRSPLPGEGAQSLHADYHRLPPDGGHYVATAIVAIDDFAGDNGATRIVPGSQRALKLDAARDHDSPHPGQRVIEMKAGSAQSIERSSRCTPNHLYASRRPDVW